MPEFDGMRVTKHTVDTCPEGVVAFEPPGSGREFVLLALSGRF